MEEFGKVLIGLVAVGVSLFIYFLPAVIANNRKHKNYIALFAANLLAGWTGIGWFMCLIWSLTYQGARK